MVPSSFGAWGRTHCGTVELALCNELAVPRMTLARHMRCGTNVINRRGIRRMVSHNVSAGGRHNRYLG